MIEFSPFEKECAKAVGKRVCVKFKDGSKPVVGKCFGHTRAVDNDPEIASVEIKLDNVDGLIMSLSEPEISSIEILDQ